jgi:hypothetical protein
MKRKNYIVTILISLMIFSGCSKDWLDINKDPNNPESATAELVLPAGVVSIGAVVGGTYNLVGGMWSQYWTQSNVANQYKFIDQYQIQSGDFNTDWREMYANGLSDLQYVLNKAEETENWSLYFMATVMQCYGFQVMVDFYDNVPYSEAFQGDAEVQNFSPSFDNGQDIYDDLIVRIDEAMALEFNELTEAQANADLMFGGDMTSWIQFANTLKLKMYIRQMYARPEVAQAGIEAMYTSGAEFLSQNAWLDIFIDEMNKDNPLYASNVRNLNVSTNLRVSATIYRYFEGNSDPRLDYIVDGGSIPLPQGGYNIKTTTIDPTTVSVFYQAATDPVYFISEIESYLLQAEAIARGWGTGDDKALYDAAVTASFARYGEDATDFIASGGAYEYPSAGTFEEKQQAIIMAKWAAFVGSQGLEAFLETNRTHYPEISAVPSWANDAFNESYVGGYLTYSLEGVTAPGEFPKRMIYPQDEVNLNANFPGQTEITGKVWWDVK